MHFRIIILIIFFWNNLKNTLKYSSLNLIREKFLFVLDETNLLWEISIPCHPPHHSIIPLWDWVIFVLTLINPSLRNLWMSSTMLAITMLDDLGWLSHDKQPTQRVKVTASFYGQFLSRFTHDERKALWEGKQLFFVYKCITNMR